ncbi:DUF6642 family protein [Hymenobacter persicinus]|uniref:DUF6642 family protein n=1 Tax=Hymenobacter persicinus TaxID=2025506 RepID=UPI0026C74506
MLRTTQKRKNICCIEGHWDEDNFRNTASIKGALDLLRDNEDVLYEHRKCSTLVEAVRIVSEFCKAEYKSFGIIYFATHGIQSCTRFDGRDISLSELADALAGKLNRKIVHFGSCETLDVRKNHLNDFLIRTGAIAVSGYTTQIDFLKSTVLDLLYFQLCQDTTSVEKIRQAMKQHYGSFSRELGFRMEFNSNFNV